jgi:hypothetical protein
MIRMHKDTTTPEAIADSIRLNLGDILETYKGMPDDITFELLMKHNPAMKAWIIEGIQMNLLTAAMMENDGENNSFTEDEFKAIEVGEEKLNAVFAILSKDTKADFVQYRLDLIAESQKKNPEIIEIG